MPPSFLLFLNTIGQLFNYFLSVFSNVRMSIISFICNSSNTEKFGDLLLCTFGYFSSGTHSSASESDKDTQWMVTFFLL